MKVLHEVEGKHITQREAAGRLGISERWVRELLIRVRQKGDQGIVHRLRGRPSNRRWARIQARAVRLVQGKYRDFGPTLAAEYLAQEEGLEVNKETLRQGLMAAGIWKRKRRRVEEVHLWRARRACWGELVQWDTSEHDWLEGRGPQLFLVAMIDDATSRALARFVEHDSTEENLRLLWTYLERYGRPGEFYADKDSMFAVNRREVTHEEDEAWEEAYTQIGRALRELEIGWIAAHSPQAKGRIERFFGTAQDRLVKGLRIAEVGALAEANEYLEEEYLPMWNQRFTVEAENPRPAHRPLRAEHDLAAILSQVEERVVAKDYTLRYARKIYQIARRDIRPGLREGSVRVEKRLDGSLAVRFRDRYLTVAECVPPPRPRSPRQHPRCVWPGGASLAAPG